MEDSFQKIEKIECLLKFGVRVTVIKNSLSISPLISSVCSPLSAKSTRLLIEKTDLAARTLQPSAPGGAAGSLDLDVVRSISTAQALKSITQTDKHPILNQPYCDACHLCLFTRAPTIVRGLFLCHAPNVSTSSPRAFYVKTIALQITSGGEPWICYVFYSDKRSEIQFWNQIAFRSAVMQWWRNLNGVTNFQQDNIATVLLLVV